MRGAGYSGASVLACPSSDPAERRTPWNYLTSREFCLLPTDTFIKFDQPSSNRRSPSSRFEAGWGVAILWIADAKFQPRLYESCILAFIPWVNACGLHLQEGTLDHIKTTFVNTCGQSVIMLAWLGLPNAIEDGLFLSEQIGVERCQRDGAYFSIDGWFVDLRGWKTAVQSESL